MSEQGNLESEIDEIEEEIAIVGMAGRFPGAADLGTFWRNLCDGRETISTFGEAELLAAGVEPGLLADPRYVRARGILDGVDRFDAGLFGMGPREAAITDPQHRVFLECAWEALELAGVDPLSFPGRIGLYAGSILSTYLLLHLLPRVRGEEGWPMVLKNDKDTLCTHVSYKLNLRGPSVTVQTACSTALVALHMARQSLLDHECDLALAGGVSIRSPQTVGYLYQEDGILSPDGHCRPFDAAARGTVFSSGAGLVVLKRLSDARADGDTVRAVIKGSAVNNDGSQKVGFTAPSLEGQAEVVARALLLGEVDPESVSYVEAHGTGTPVGDPMEVAALTRAFRGIGATDCGYCALGSVKSNIGHLDCAAGAVGLIKTVLALEHRRIPPTLHFERPNPQIDFESSPFFVNDRPRDWECAAGPRRAGVSSLGIGGTNVHVVLEEAPPDPDPSPSLPWQLLVLSGRTENALERSTARLAEHLRDRPKQELADVAFTLKVGRQALPRRRALVCRDRAEAIELLEGRQTFDAVVGDGGTEVAFLFPGQGSQMLHMGAELYEARPLFRREIDRSAELLRPHLGEDLRHLLFPQEREGKEAQRRLRRTEIAQPALFVVETALARLWMAMGVRPRAMAGHSVGELVATHLAGVMSLEDALALVAARGRLIGQLPGGSMAAVALGEAEVVATLPPELDLAAVNGSSQCVVSGSDEAIETFLAELSETGLKGKRLATSHAFHSRHMDPAVEPFARLVAGIPLRSPEIPFLSNVTGDWIKEEEATDPGYWARHLRQTVRFCDSLDLLLGDPRLLLLEVGPGRALTRMARRQSRASGDSKSLAVSSLFADRQDRGELAAFVGATARLWTAGVAIDWRTTHDEESRRRIPLPTYPFDRERHWVELATPPRGTSAEDAPAIGDGDDPAGWFRLPAWRRSLPPRPAKLNRVGTWLMFLDDGPFGDEMAQDLERAGENVVRIAPQDDRPEHCAPLLHQLRQSGRTPIVVLHLRCLTPVSDPIQDLGEGRRRGFDSLSALTQALLGNDLGNHTTIAAVSNGVQRVTGHEDLSPAKATLLGWRRTVAAEGTPLRCLSIDIDLPALGSAARKRLAERILAEARAEMPASEVAYRGGDRWLPAFEAAPLEAPERPASWLRPNGAYLLTGGLDALPLAMAERLADVGPVRLAFLAPQERKGSDERRRALEELGAEVMVLSAAPADREALRTALGLIEKTWGELHGIFYLPEQSGPAPWMEGALSLDLLLGDREPLDFFVLFSWLEPPEETPGRPELRAASALLDTLALKRASGSGNTGAGKAGAGNTVAVDWGAAAGFDVDSSFGLLDRVLSRPGVPRIAVLPPKRTAATGEAGANGRGRARAKPQGDPLATDDPIVIRIAEIWREVLGVERIGSKDSFFDLGGDSLIALQVMARLRDVFPVELPARVLFEHPTVPELQGAVEDALVRKLERLSEEEAQRLLESFPN